MAAFSLNGYENIDRNIFSHSRKIVEINILNIAYTCSSYEALHSYDVHCGFIAVTVMYGAILWLRHGYVMVSYVQFSSLCMFLYISVSLPIYCFVSISGSLSLCYFISMLTREDTSSLPVQDVTPEIVARNIKAMKDNKSPAVGGIPPRLLMETVE